MFLSGHPTCETTQTPSHQPTEVSPNIVPRSSTASAFTTPYKPAYSVPFLFSPSHDQSPFHALSLFSLLPSFLCPHAGRHHNSSRISQKINVLLLILPAGAEISILFEDSRTRRSFLVLLLSPWIPVSSSSTRPSKFEYRTESSSWYLLPQSETVYPLSQTLRRPRPIPLSTPWSKSSSICAERTIFHRLLAGFGTGLQMD